MKKVSKEKPLITVIVPIYKVEEYLNRCIESIINQTYENLEIILIDDGSPDNCPKMCDEWAKKDKRIKVIHKENGGLSDARNKGIEQTNGKYITFIDSDDYVEKNYVIELYNAISINDCDISISGIVVKYTNGTIINKYTNIKEELTPKETIKKILYDDGIDISATAKLYKKEVFKNIRFPKDRLYEDAATTYKLICSSKKIANNSVSTYIYMIRNDSIAQSTFNKKKMDLIKSTKEMTDFIKDKYPDLSDACDRRLMYAYLSTISQLASSKKVYKKEEKLLMEYIKKNSKKTLKDKKCPKRDKLAIISLKFGFKFYKFVWNLYRRATGRI